MHHQALVLIHETDLGLGLHLQLSRLGRSWAMLGQGKVALQGLTVSCVPVPPPELDPLCLSDRDGAAGDSEVEQAHWDTLALPRNL